MSLIFDLYGVRFVDVSIKSLIQLSDSESKMLEVASLRGLPRLDLGLTCAVKKRRSNW